MVDAASGITCAWLYQEETLERKPYTTFVAIPGGTNGVELC
jgi:hypothetical protein